MRHVQSERVANETHGTWSVRSERIPHRFKLVRYFVPTQFVMSFERALVRLIGARTVALNGLENVNHLLSLIFHCHSRV